MQQELIRKRFAELGSQFSTIEATKKPLTSGFTGFTVEADVLLNWSVKARNLLRTACGPDSEHYNQFLEAEKPASLRTNHEKLKQLAAVFMAAKEDFEGGYLISFRNLVQAEVFDSELDQSRELLAGNYKVAAAVIAGVVLETTLRQMCLDRNLPIGKLDRMNADLAKAGRYNSLVQKRITALADLRNQAAHGHAAAFTNVDVADMINYVETFLSERL